MSVVDHSRLFVENPGFDTITFSSPLHFCFQKFVGNAQQCFAFTAQALFPAHNLNFLKSFLFYEHFYKGSLQLIQLQRYSNTHRREIFIEFEFHSARKFSVY